MPSRRRRQAIAAIFGAAFAWPGLLNAQRTKDARTLGVLMALPGDDPEFKRRVAVFQSELKRLGWTENANLRIEERWTAGLVTAGGLFWAPGIDLTGQRKILGFGAATQFDTRIDRDQVFGNQLIIFLAQRSRVDILRDGRLLTSRSYEAGNQTLDTAGLPDGSYEVVLHIQEIGGRVREERRFFINNARIPPLGQPVYFGYAGMLVDDRAAGGLLPSTTPFFEFGAARRLSDEIAVDATVLGTSQKVLAEIGGYLITDFGQFRLAGLSL